MDSFIQTVTAQTNKNRSQAVNNAPLRLQCPHIQYFVTCSYYIESHKMS